MEKKRAGVCVCVTSQKDKGKRVHGIRLHAIKNQSYRIARHQNNLISDNFLYQTLGRLKLVSQDWVNMP